MPKIRRRGLARGGELPGTLRRSSKEAQETFTKARDSAVRTHGEGDQADRAAYAEFKRTFEKRGDHWIPKRSADSGDLALTSLDAAPRLRRRSPPCMRWRGPRLVPGRPGRLTGRLAPRTARRGRTSARTAGFPAPPASLRSPPDDAVSNGESILTGPAGRRQGPAGNHLRFFRRPHFIHSGQLVIRITWHLSTGLCTVNPQLP